MGKITVKHYLNTKAKPSNLTDSGSTKETYPVYVQIIYNRHSTNKRSDTLIESTIEGFEYYQKTGEILKNHFFTLFSDGYSLATEKTIITNSIKILEDNNISFDIADLMKVFEYYSKNIAECLTNQLEIDMGVEGLKVKEDGSIEPSEYNDFILSFKNTFGIIQSFENIKKYTDIDLLKFVKPEDLLRLKAVHLIAKSYHNVSFAEFYYLDYHSRLKELLKNHTVDFFEQLISIIDVLLVEYAGSKGYSKIFAK